MPRILVLTLSFGSGHVRAAEAIAKELKHQAPGAEVSVIDALRESRRLFLLCYEWPYWLMLRYAPFLWGRLSAARIKHQHNGTAPSWAFELGCPRVFEAIEAFRPDVIVAAEVGACEIAAIARRRGLTQARIVNVITDYKSEPIWVQPEVALFLVADKNVSAELNGWGAPSDRIVVSGIPIDPAFLKKQNQTETRRRHALDDDRPLVLLMGGGMGPTRMHEVARALAQSKVPMHIVAVAGHDKRARRKLERIKAGPLVSLKILGWTDDAPALMQAASVLVTKPGGLTITEAILSGVPMVLFDPIPAVEERNAARLVEAGAALLTSTPEETASAVIALLRDERARRAMSTKARSLANGDAAKTIARMVLYGQTAADAAVRTMTA